MLTDTAYLALLLDAPLQSWGYESRFQRRTTGLHPTKSGVIGLICAAMGLAKGSEEERDMLPRLGELRMTSIAIPRQRSNPWTAESEEMAVRRLEDFHTVLKTRRATGSIRRVQPVGTTDGRRWTPPDRSRRWPRTPTRQRRCRVGG